MMLLLLYQKNIMRKSLQLLKNGFLGFNLSSSQAQSSLPESKKAQSLLKQNIVTRIKQVTQGMPEQKLILTLVIPLLDGMEDKKIAAMLVMVRDEFNIIIDDYNQEQQPTATIEIGDTTIEAVTFID